MAKIPVARVGIVLTKAPFSLRRANALDAVVRSLCRQQFGDGAQSCLVLEGRYLLIKFLLVNYSLLIGFSPSQVAHLSRILAKSCPFAPLISDNSITVPGWAWAVKYTKRPSGAPE